MYSARFMSYVPTSHAISQLKVVLCENVFMAFNQLRCTAILHRHGATWVYKKTLVHDINRAYYTAAQLFVHDVHYVHSIPPGRSVGRSWSVVVSHLEVTPLQCRHRPVCPQARRVTRRSRRRRSCTSTSVAVRR